MNLLPALVAFGVEWLGWFLAARRLRLALDGRAGVGYVLGEVALAYSALAAFTCVDGWLARGAVVACALVGAGTGWWMGMRQRG